MNVYKKILQVAGAKNESISVMSDDDAKKTALSLEYANQDDLFMLPARSRRLPAHLAKMQNENEGDAPLCEEQPDELVGEQHTYRFQTRYNASNIDNWRLSAVVEWLLLIAPKVEGDEEGIIQITVPLLLNIEWWQGYFFNLDCNGDIAYDPNEYTVCERCGEVVAYGSTTTVHVKHGGEEQWCEDCVDDHAFHCDHCDEWYDGSWFNSYETTDHDFVCEGCLDSWYSVCQDCGLAVYEDDVVWIDDEPYCEGCAASHEDVADDYRIRGYHCNPFCHWHYANGEKEHGRLIGCEVETEYGDVEERCDITQEFGANEEYIYQMHDGSLDSTGIECITQPMSKAFFNAFDFEGWMAALVKAGARSHDTANCGLHVHLAKEWFGSTQEKQEATAAAVLVFMDKYKDELQKLARRDDTRWCHYPSEPDFGDGSKETCEKALKEKTHKGFLKEAKKNLYKGYRYHCLNTASSRPTYEFRIFRGTLNPNTFRASVELCIRLVEYAKWKNRNNSHIYSWEQFKSFKRMPKLLAAYIEKHNL